MFKRKLFLLAFLLAILLVATPAQAGGWAVITLSEFPTAVAAGEPVTVEFAVRQHGTHLTSSFGAPTVYARHPESGETLEVESAPMAPEGFYAAELLFPQAGAWEWGIGIYGSSEDAQTMPVLDVRAGGAAGQPAVSSAPFAAPVMAGFAGLIVFVMAGALYFATRKRWALGVGLAGVVLGVVGLALAVQRPVAASAAPAETAAVVSSAAAFGSEAEYGKILFQSKGCVVCHSHNEGRVGYTGITTDMGLNLTRTLLPVEYLQVWLKDPAALKPETLMPNLELKEAEINALAAFLTAWDDAP